MTDRHTSWSCPRCGFHVFNRRYPKCESCGAPLPESFLLSSAEREALADAAMASVNEQISDAERARADAAALREQAQTTVPDAAALGAIAAVILSTGEG